MTFLLPLVALALAFAAPLLLRTDRGPVQPARAVSLLALVVIAGLLIFRSAPEIDRTPALLGLLIGAAAAVCGARGGGVAFGVAAASALHLLPAASLPTAGMALVAGTGLGALTVGGELSALAAVLVVAADNLGMRHSQIPAFAFVGSQVGLAVAIGGFISSAFVSGLLPRNLAAGRSIVVGIVVAAAGLLVSKTVKGSGLQIATGVGALAGVIVHFLMPDDEGDSSRVGLAAVIGIGLATIAFGLGKGVGLALAALAAVGVLLAVENRRAVLALGPLVGLALFHVLREAGTGATRALDIGQHYTLLALILGLTLPLLPVDWLAFRGRVTGAVGAAVWGVAAIATPPLVIIAFGMRGGVGFIVGLGVVGLVQAMRHVEGFRRTETQADLNAELPLTPNPLPRRGEGVSGLQPLALGAGLGGATILALGWLGDESTLSRDDKVRMFAYAAVGIAILASILALLARKTETEVAS